MCFQKIKIIHAWERNIIFRKSVKLSLLDQLSELISQPNDPFIFSMLTKDVQHIVEYITYLHHRPVVLEVGHLTRIT